VGNEKETALIALRHRLGQIREFRTRCEMRAINGTDAETRERYTAFVAEYDRLERETLAAIAWVQAREPHAEGGE
jgi:hypothetical protein